jgi:hypothetical protein
MAKRPAKFSSIPMVGINALFAVGFLWMYKRTCTRAKKSGSVRQEDESEEKVGAKPTGMESC